MVLLALALAAAPSATVKLAAPGTTCVGLEQRLCDVYLEHFVSLLSEGGGVRVTSRRDIEQLLGFERQKQLLGCDAGGCMAELTGALGVDGVLAASIARTGSGYLVTVRVIRARDGTAWAQATARAGSEDELQTRLEEEARALRGQLAPTDVGSAEPSLVRWVPAIAGGACLAAGVTLFIWSKADAAQLANTATAMSPNDVATTAARGKVTQPLGVALMGVGAAGVAASLLWAALAPSATTQVSVVPITGGAALTVGGTFP